MKKFGEDFTDVKYQVKDHTKQLETFSEVIKENKDITTNKDSCNYQWNKLRY